MLPLGQQEKIVPDQSGVIVKDSLQLPMVRSGKSLTASIAVTKNPAISNNSVTLVGTIMSYVLK